VPDEKKKVFVDLTYWGENKEEEMEEETNSKWR
jgi:hypothetical protein